MLSAIARDRLTTLVATVASGQAFSVSACVIDDKRTRMIEETVEACICLQDWIRAEETIE